MCNHWTEAKLFKFLRLYKRYECLWNPYSPDYGSCDAKSEAFSQILCEMNVFGLTVTECLNQIKHVRETYKQEQQRLESLAFLGGRSYSNLLWYPLMNSMLSKVVRDEEKLNQATGNLDLVVTPQCLPFNSGDHWSRRESDRIRYGQRTVSWDHGETTTIYPYLPNYATTNEHISSCVTCGYSSGSCCDCFSMNDNGYDTNNYGESYNSESQINYRPRTSYNYRNGILEINSAVRIPVSQPSPNYGYRRLIESITPEEPEYNFDEISSSYRPNLHDVEEEKEFLTECCAKSYNCNERQDKVSDDSLETLHRADNNHCNLLNLPINKNGVRIKNINRRLKQSKRTKGSINEMLYTQNILGLIDVVEKPICENIKHEENSRDNKKSLVCDEENLKNDIHSSRVESTKFFAAAEKNVMLESQRQNNLNIIDEMASGSDVNVTNANMKVEQASTFASENKQPMKQINVTKVSQAKPQSSHDDSILTAEISQPKNCQVELNSLRSEKIKTKDESDQQCSLKVTTTDCNEKIYDVKTTEDLVRQSKNIIKHNLTKIVMDFIDETLHKPIDRTAVSAEERLIIKKVAKDLQSLRNKSTCVCDDKSMIEDHRESQQNDSIKSRNKTICWREPIEESFNIIPCKSIRSPANEKNYKEDVLAGKSIQANKSTAHCVRMMAGADFDIEHDAKQSNLLIQEDTRSKNKKPSTNEYYTFTNNTKTRLQDLGSPNYEEYFEAVTDRKQRQSHAYNTEAFQTNPEKRLAQLINEKELGNSISVFKYQTLKLSHSTNGIENKECPTVIIDKSCPPEESIDLDLQNFEPDGQLIKIENKLNAKSCESRVDNLDCCDSSSTLHDITEKENTVTIKISIVISESTEKEIIDKVVNKITDTLRKTLDKNGYAIEKKQFFTKKNLITNDNGEINRKMIGNEAVWKTELKNIIGSLMKDKTTGDSITFKVKTMILPVITNQPNGTADSASSSQTRKKLIRNKKTGLVEIQRTSTDSKTKKLTAQDEISSNTREFSFRDEGEISNTSGDKRKRIMESFELELNVNRMARLNASDSITDREENDKKPLRKLLRKTEIKACDEEFKGFDSDVLLYKSSRDRQLKKKLLINQMKKSYKRNKRIIIPRCTLASSKYLQLDKFLINDTNRTTLPKNNHMRALLKMLKCLVKFRNKFQSIPEISEKTLLRSQLREDEYGIMDHEELKENLIDRYQQKDDFVAASYCNRIPRHLNEDIDVYLCTEISQEDQLTTQKKDASCYYYSDNSVPRDVNRNSISTSTEIQENNPIKSTTNNYIQETVRKCEQDLSEWESLSDSDEETDTVKYCEVSKRRSKRNTSRKRYGFTKNSNQKSRSSHDYLLADPLCEQNYHAVYRALTEIPNNTFWYDNQANEVKMLDNIIQPNNKKYFISTQASESRSTPSLQNNCNIVNILSSNNQNGSQKEVRSFEEDSKASLCCTEFEDAQDTNKHQMPIRSESEEGQALLEAKLRIAADNHILPCCAGGQATSVCTPICDVSSRLRLCAIIKSPNGASTANRNIPTNNTCCCDDMDKLQNAVGAYWKSCMDSSRKNAMIGDANVQSMSESCQTESHKKDLSTVKSQNHTSRNNCRGNSGSSFQVLCDEAHANNFTATHTKIPKINENIIRRDNVDHSKSATVTRTTVQSNNPNLASTSLDISALGGESLFVEVKLLQPLFSIELKRGIKYPEKTGSLDKQNSSEFSAQNKCGANISPGQDSVIESNTKNGVTSSINKTTLNKSLKCGVQRIVDQGPQLSPEKSAEETSACGIQTSQICQIESDSSKRIKVCSEDSISINSVALSLSKKNSLISFENKLDCLDPGQCNMLFDALRSFNNCQNSCVFPAKNSIACTEKALPQLKKNLSYETESITITTLINAVETSLQHITDPIICQKLTEMIELIRDRDQRRNYSLKKTDSQGGACGTLKKTLNENEIQVQVKCGNDNIRSKSLLSITKDNEYQKSCEFQAVHTADSSRNIEEMVYDVKSLQHESMQSKRDACNPQTTTEFPTNHTVMTKVLDQISANEGQTIVLKAEKSSRQSTPRLILIEDKISLCDASCASEIGARKKVTSKSPRPKSQFSKVVDSNNIFDDNRVLSADEQSELRGNSHLMNTLNYSSTEISCGVEEVASDSSSYECSFNEGISMSPPLQNDENYESSKYYCCPVESMEIDINAFANTVASQLRGLSTEAALRSQQRIQTLISNSRLESEKNKNYR